MNFYIYDYIIFEIYILLPTVGCCSARSSYRHSESGFNTKKVSHWFPDIRVPKVLLLPPQKIGFLAQKQPKLAQNWHFWPNIGIFGPFDLPDERTMRTSCLGGISIMWVPKLLLTPVKIRIFGPKRPNLVQNMHFWSFWAKYWHFWPI